MEIFGRERNHSRSCGGSSRREIEKHQTRANARYFLAIQGDRAGEEGDSEDHAQSRQLHMTKLLKNLAEAFILPVR
jgi:hypothetical protein